MAKKVFKYTLEFIETQTLQLPVGAEILTVQTQNEQACIWALVDPNAESEDWTFNIYGTGHEIKNPEPLMYIGTFQKQSGAFIFHVFTTINS